MGVLSWILFGLIVGAIANALDPRPAQGGIFGSIILGIIGALVGGFVGSMLFGVGISGFDFTSFLLAVAGALVLLFIGRSFTRGRTI